MLVLEGLHFNQFGLLGDAPPQFLNLGEEPLLRIGLVSRGCREHSVVGAPAEGMRLTLFRPRARFEEVLLVLCAQKVKKRWHVVAQTCELFLEGLDHDRYLVPHYFVFVEHILQGVVFGDFVDFSACSHNVLDFLNLTLLGFAVDLILVGALLLLYRVDIVFSLAIFAKELLRRQAEMVDLNNGLLDLAG